MTANTARPAQADKAPEAGAVSRKGMGWQAIDWQQAHRNVRRLQVRIVKATQAGRWNKVKALATSAYPLLQRQGHCR